MENRPKQKILTPGKLKWAKAYRKKCLKCHRETNNYLEMDSYE